MGPYYADISKYVTVTEDKLLYIKLFLGKSARYTRLQGMFNIIPWKTFIYWITLAFAWIKGEIHSKIESILKQRVHFYLQNSEQIMKIGWEIRKIWHFEISHFFRKTLLDQSLWIFKWASWWCHPHIPISKCIRVNIISHLLWVVIRQVLYSHSWNMRFLSFLYMKWIENCEGMTSSTRSFEYS